MTRYWYLQHFAPGLVLEKGWISDNCDEKNQWFYYDKVEDIQTLLNNLSEFNESEKRLKSEITKVRNDVTKRLLEEKDKIASDPELPFGIDNLLGELKEELIDVAARICKATLGTLEDSWKDRVLSVQNCSDFYPCFSALFESIHDKSRTGMLKRKEVIGGSSLGIVMVNSKEADLWLKEVERCKSLSKLHVLLAIFNNAISWDKSILNMTCSFCHRKSTDRNFLICSGCGKGFHKNCVVVDAENNADEWKCFGCLRLRPRNKNVCFRQDKGSEDEDDDEEDTEYDESDDISQHSGSESEEEEEKDTVQVNCCKCKGKDGEDLVVCSECSKGYHIECHSPPLRRCPRGQWKCGRCTNRGLPKSKGKKSKQSATSRKKCKR